MYTFWLIIGGFVLLFLFVLSVVRYRELPLLALLALQPLKQFLLIHVPVFRTVDPTLIAAIWLVLVALIVLPRARGLLQDAPKLLFACQLLLAAWVLVSLIWTPAPDYGAYKGLRFSFLNTAVMVTPFALLLDRESLQRLTLGIVLIATVVYTKISVAPSYAVPWFSDDKFFRAGFLYGSDAAPLSHQLAGAFCLAAVFGARRLWVRALATCALPALMYGAWLTGTRATVMAMIISGVLIILMSKQPNKWLKGLGLMAVFVFVFVIAYVASPEAQQQRIVQGLTGVDESSMSRVHHWATALRAFASNPMGAGIGSFATFDGGYDGRWFPHSIVLETFAELGVLGGALLGGLFAAFVAHVYRMRRRLGHWSSPTRLLADAWLVATIASLAVGLVTDDLADNRSIWMAMGVCLVAYHHCLVEAGQEEYGPVTYEGLVSAY